MMLNEKTAFSERLNLALNASLSDIPRKGGGRQDYVAKLFGVSQPAARKWLEGDGLPKLEQCITIVKRLNLSIEWLLTGRGGMRMTNPGIKAANQAEKAIDLWLIMPQEIQDAWLNYGEYLLEKNKPESENNKKKVKTVTYDQR